MKTAKLCKTIFVPPSDSDNLRLERRLQNVVKPIRTFLKHGPLSPLLPEFMKTFPFVLARRRI